MLEIASSTQNGRVPVTVLHVDGNLDASTHEKFTAKANELIKNGSLYFLIDLSKTKFISSAGFRAFNDLFNKLREIHTESFMTEEEVNKGIHEGTYKSPHLKLLSLSEYSQRPFELAGFNLFIETFDDLKTAIDSF